MKHLWAVALCVLTACEVSSSAGASREAAPDVQQIGRIQHPNVSESSGVVASRRHRDVFWTHTDGGGIPMLYAMSRDGKPLAEVRVNGATVGDWEDIATDSEGHLFLADTGNNHGRRTEVAVYQVDEPQRVASGAVKVTSAWLLRFPGKPFDSEGLFIWRGYGYLISKVSNDARAELYRFSLTNSMPQTLERVAELKIESPVTGADISPDGTLLAAVAKNGAYVFRIDGDPSRATKKPKHVKFKHDKMEACTFVPEGLLATAESREVFLFTSPEFRAKAP